MRSPHFIIALLLSLVFSGQINGQELRISPSTRISLITCGPWQGELYSAFGHSAIRVYDPVTNTDWAFNYGTFDFNQPNFYLNFARGRNLYMLSVQDYPAFRDYYITHNRYIHEQVLDLDFHQSQRLFRYLWNNAQPENRQYPYDYFYDNCSTRPKDVLKTVFGDDLTFDYRWAKPGPTIRDLTDLYLKDQPWGDLGIDICLGLPMDKIASAEEHFFLPDFLEVGLDHASIKQDSAMRPLVRERQIIHEAEPESSGLSVTHPWVVFGLLLLVVLVISVRDHRRGKLTAVVDHLLLTVTGSMGLLLTLLWTATDHRAAAMNMNLLWAMPTNLLLPYLLKGKPLILFYRIMTVVTIALLLAWPVLPQELNLFLIPVILALLVRYILNASLRRLSV